jgi:hypothetical protein
VGLVCLSSVRPYPTMIDTNFCPYKVEYDSDDDDNQSASDKVPELVPHSHDKGSNKPVSPEKGENQSAVSLGHERGDACC